MRKIKISQDLLWYEILFYLLIFLSLFLIIFSKLSFSILCFFPILFLIPLFIHLSVTKIWYDENNIYFFEKGEEISVPLEDLVKISELFFQLNRVNVWYILFPDKEGNLKKIRFLPNWDTFLKLKNILSDLKYKTEVRITETKFW